MNKKRCIFLCMAILICVYSGSILVRADEQQTPRVSVEAMIDRWEEEGYPDFVGGAGKSVDGITQWIIYLKENTPENQEAVSKEISSKYPIQFQACTYSHNELIPIRDQIIQEYITAGATSVKRVDIRCQSWGDIGPIGPRVVVSLISSDGYSEWINLFHQKYGDVVLVGVWAEIPLLIVPAIKPVETPVPDAPAQTPEATPGAGEDAGNSTPDIKIKIKGVNQQGKKLMIKWSKVSQADKYQIKISQNKDLTKAQKVICKKTSYQYRINKKTSQVYIIVRAHDKDSKKWSDWSKKVKVKCK